MTYFFLKGIYTAKEWYSFVEIVNIFDKEKIVYIEQPVETIPYQNFIDVNNSTIEENIINIKKK